MTILAATALGGCSSIADGQKYSVFFRPYSAELDPLARETIQAAADFARAYPLQGVRVTGYSAPPDPKLDVPGLSAKRADTVRQILIADGVGADRVTTASNGITDPKTLPTVSVRRVDIIVGP